MEASLVIPALNEEESLGIVLEQVDRSLLKEIILVDGGSSDGTVAIARENGAQVIQEVGYHHEQGGAALLYAAAGDGGSKVGLAAAAGAAEHEPA